MSIIDLVIIAFGLSMDAFAVSICKGLSVQRVNLRHMTIAGSWFGGFQALMPLLGYFLGSQFEQYIVQWDHWIAFVFLGVIGANMIKEGMQEDCPVGNFSARSMLPLALATSIDAMVIGITLAFLHINIWFAVAIIGIITFLMSSAGVKLGHRFGENYRSISQRLGGIILILMGLKILIQHLME